MRERPLRIAILTHSTNPRGGVVHALCLGEALTELGHDAVVHAPDPGGQGFFRAARCRTVPVAARPMAGSTAELVGARIADYQRHFASPAACDFDVFHAQDAISGNALTTLMRRRLIPAFVRTVHHLDQFAEPQLAYWHDRAIYEATRLLCVSRLWQETLKRDYGLCADSVGNGVDTSAYGPVPSERDAALRAEWGIGPGPVYLSVGGFEERKNALRIIEAFARVRADRPEAQLVVVGGASLLDHSGYQARCRAALDQAGLDIGVGRAVIRTGPVPQEAMPAFYRLADALVFPSLKEGFGLSVLEAMASGTPTIVADLAPFTEYLTPGDTLFVDPEDVPAIATAMLAVLAPDLRARLVAAGPGIAGRHSWRACAAKHVAAYATCGDRKRALSDA
ncbi:glycosyl transferase family 1 [Methylobacterium sp. Leaf399]|uniref:MSMEG_0565 family glycosyltransferase n=1 Tax=Methylobacterium sp. Leaf399 TaxID=1736364 RepID=UPI0006F3FCF9|nr:MSMEG_0565 family glycosyltransferase [Methylobacterium sp. Leaf399]KQT19455.1 glycosyl transferase family 1 [Methylobacterium sp. Leaf399]